ncbi:hypothetical protein [Nonomuraea sp. NPDC049784]|uniref:hypothetical protein n=1 Tax=Nonomuraea sp. NPDC049784 TaxID=3154361 RepID=UPI00340DC73E
MEAYAGGAALMASGIEVSRLADIVTLVDDAIPEATSLALSFNLDVVTMGGSLSAAQPLITSIRTAAWERRLPPATRDLEAAALKVTP